MRKKMVAGNWKMNLDFEKAEELMDMLADLLEAKEPTHCEVVVCPSFVYMELAADYAQEAGFELGAQNVSAFEDGAYTGEVSANMLEKLGVTYVIIGHSERRAYFHESSDILEQKVERALEHHLQPIFCCGELLEDRKQQNHFKVVEAQLKETILKLSPEEFSNVVVAYEPVWAIGTGETATPEQAQEMHAFIREMIKKAYNEKVAEETTILYGGSCKPSNAKELFAKKDVDGGLIGGASLKAADFNAIIHSY
ncbi:MAG: triose-phosphate isomerase [Bacteroidetes bacterium]|nr:MAG: triose-phosphate isomerase [Bacteroidota bacterium]PIE87706.1 MAG: triose-phosphate isomerase [Bacteroidota bacterium]